MANDHLRMIVPALLILFVAGAAAAFDEAEVDAVVIPGSVGNRIAFTVSNPSTTMAAENLTLRVTSRPKWLEPSEVRSDSEGPLAPGQARRFELIFDVQDDAEVDSVRELEVGLSADRAFFDHSKLVVKLGVAQRSLRLLSIEFGREPGAEIEWQAGQPGFIERDEVAPGEFDVETFCFQQLPLEITPREPLHFSLRSEVREAYSKGHYCQNRETAEGSHPRMWLSLNQKDVTVEARADLLSYCDEGLVEEAGKNVKEATDLQTSFELAIELRPKPDEPGIYQARLHSEEELTNDQLSGAEIKLKSTLILVGPEQLTVRYGLPDIEHPAMTELTPCPSAPELANPPRGGGPLRYQYGYWLINYSGSGYSVSGGVISATVVEKGSGQGWFTKRLLRDPPGAGEQATAEWRNDLTTYACQGGRENIYDHPYYWSSLTVTADGPYDTREEAEVRAPESGFDWSSTELTSEELWAAFGCEEGSRKPGDPMIADALTGGGAPPGPDPVENTNVIPPPTDMDTTAFDPTDPTHTNTTAFDPADPATMDPDRHPEVAGLIREWLAVAKPPGNAVPGVNSWYDEYGRTMGGGGSTGRVIGSHDTVDYGAGASSEARVWSALRTQLDSIDHCLLEEYVVTTIQGGSIDHCHGRWRALRDLQGVELATATSEVQAGGFEVQLAPGTPAPAPALDGAVERQDPPPSRSLRRGQTLTLTVYAPYVPQANAAPDVVGLSRAEAKQRLEDEGFIGVLQPGAPARSPAESDTIESQEPPPGTVLEPGAAVAIWVRPSFVAATTIPDLRGLSTSEARLALEVAGIERTMIDLLPGNPAPGAALAGTIESQEPAAGSLVEPGTRVSVTVHSGFVDLRTVDSVIGLSSGEARRRLAALGLQVQLAPGKPAPLPGAENTVQTQSPAAGASVSAGSVVTLSIHSPWIPPPTPVPTVLSPTPISGGTGQGQLPLPDLQCPAFVTLRSDSDLCINPQMNPPPVGSQVPLDHEHSGFENSPGTTEYGRYYFKCYYRIGSGYRSFMSLDWTHGQYQGVVWDNCDNRVEGERFGGTYGFFSPTHFVQAKLNGNCFNAQENEALLRQYIRQVEPFARPCSGPIVRTPTPVPPPPTNTPVPPAVPPACPGPGTPEIYKLWNPPPYGGLGGLICQDATNKLWINVSNNIHPISNITLGSKDPSSECWWATKVTIPGHTYEGNLCR